MRVPFLSLLVIIGGCSEQGFHSVDKNGDGDGPAIEVSPRSLDFGLLGHGDEAVVQQFRIKSVGATDLTLGAIDIQDAGSASFTVLTDLEGYVLPPGAEEVVDVAFEPMGANLQRAEAWVGSDADEVPVVELLGEGAVPELQITPDPLSFGNSYVGCEKANEVTLTNIGTDTLILGDAEWSGDETITPLDLDALVFPLTLEPLDSETVFFLFDPQDEITYSGELSVTSNEPLGVRTATQTGDGKFAAEYVDEWEIPTDPPSDIIFSIDQSCSMDDDQQKLAQNFGTFINELSNYSNDWQIMVVNDDNGCNNSGILRPTQSNYQSVFGAAVSSGGGIYTEALLTVTKNAVENTDSGECNQNFMRPDSMLHIIVVSDEPEQSTYMGGMSWSDNVQAIIDKKGSTSNVRISGIYGPVPGGCGSNDAGTGYDEAVNATGGVFMSICSDWASSTNLQVLAEASINQATFELEHTPIPDTIQVWHNGQERSTWTYDETANEVTITEKIPEEGDSVEISYAGKANCD